MKGHNTAETSQVVDQEWITFPGGELEGKRPKALCAACRERLQQLVNRKSPANRATSANPAAAPLCFQCYRGEVDRERGLKAAGQIDTASDARFQCTLPFEPVNRARLERLRAERETARVAARAGAGELVDKRRHAQIAARHALQGIAAGLKMRGVVKPETDRIMASAIHAAEMQLPEAWLSFVVSR
jgi:hypothetical protein